MRRALKYLIALSLLLALSAKSESSTVYTAEELFTIPWGANPGELSLFWKTPDPDGYLGLEAPSPYAISETAGYIVHDCPSDDMRRLSKYTINGVFVVQINLWELYMSVPNELYISDSGMVLLQSGKEIYLLDHNLNHVSNLDLPTESSSFFPATNGGFWGIYWDFDTFTDPVKIYSFCYNPDGTTTTPILLYMGNKTDQSAKLFNYISPEGSILDRFVDQYGYSYNIETEYVAAAQGFKMTFSRISPQEEIVYIHELPLITEWWHTDFLVSHSGNYFTQIGTPEGTVITKYTLHRDPTCQIIVLTPMPYCGQCPALIEFLANASDPDNDELTYHWDFNGDSIFNGVGDEYTGDPWNPSHAFTQAGIHAVTLKVTDNYQGECICAIPVQVEFE